MLWKSSRWMKNGAAGLALCIVILGTQSLGEHIISKLSVSSPVAQQSDEGMSQEFTPPSFHDTKRSMTALRTPCSSAENTAISYSKTEPLLDNHPYTAACSYLNPVVYEAGIYIEDQPAFHHGY